MQLLRRWAFPLFIVVMAYIGRSVLLPFVFAGLIAYILAPVVRWMAEGPKGPRMPRGLAIVICYLTFLAAVVGFLTVLVPRVINDGRRIQAEVPELQRKLNDEWMPGLAAWVERNLGFLALPQQAAAPRDPLLPDDTAFVVTPLGDGRLAVSVPSGSVSLVPSGNGYTLSTGVSRGASESTLDRLRSALAHSVDGASAYVNDLLRIGGRVVGGVMRGIFLFFLTLMLGAFLMMDMERVHGFVRGLFPSTFRGDYDTIMSGIDRGLSGVIRGQLIICLVNGILTYIGMALLSVKYSLLLSVIAAIMSLIPIFGSILSTFPIIMAALVSGTHGLDVGRAILATAWIVAIHFVEANFLNPKIIGSAAKIHPLLVIFALILGEHSYGLVGALLAVPLLSAVQVVFMYFYRKRWLEPGVSNVPGAVPVTASGVGSIVPPDATGKTEPSSTPPTSE